MHTVQPGVARDGDFGGVEVLLAEHGLFQQVHHFRPLDQFVHAGAADLVGVDHLVAPAASSLGAASGAWHTATMRRCGVERTGRNGEEHVFRILGKQAEHALDVAPIPTARKPRHRCSRSVQQPRPSLLAASTSAASPVHHDEWGLGHGQAPGHFDGEGVAAEHGKPRLHARRPLFFQVERCLPDAFLELEQACS